MREDNWLAGDQPKSAIVVTVLGLIGAAIGGGVGFVVFEWVFSQGLYAMILPGAAIGLGCGLLTRQYSPFNGIICAVLAIGVACYVEWHFFPFLADPSLEYFIAHIHKLRGMTLLMIAFGAYLAYRLGACGSHRGRYVSRVDPQDENRY